KGFLKYGRKWKTDLHANFTMVCITNEFNTSQTCMHWYQKPLHPVQVKKANGGSTIQSNRHSFLCVNLRCISVRAGMEMHSRDSALAAAIRLSGLSILLFGVTFPPWDPALTHEKTARFIKAIRLFLEYKYKDNNEN
ncbi:MAG: hypothetical protein EXX96DRAFT_487983, partial [Benjaminiella poitrasii]